MMLLIVLCYCCFILIISVCLLELLYFTFSIGLIIVEFFSFFICLN